MKPAFAGLAVVLAAASVSLSAQSPRRDGDWEIKMIMEMGGRTMEMPSRQCITKEQANDVANTVPAGPGSRNCKVADHKTTGNTVTFSMTCEGPPPSKTDAEMVYTNDTFTGTLTSVTGGQTMVMKMSGKRLGDCTQATPKGPGK